MTNETQLLITAISAVLALALGYLIAWLRLSMRLSAKESAWKTHTESHYVKREDYLDIQNTLDEKLQRIEQLSRENAALANSNGHLKQRIEEHQSDLQAMAEKMTQEFRLISNELMEEKSEKLSKLNQEKLHAILNPLGEKIASFEKKVDETYVKGTQERAGLKEHLEQLQKINAHLTAGAERLANAVRGDSQFQGQWGEIQLERLLQNAGLKKGEHYSHQESLRDEHGKLTRPDFIINLPDDKHIIIDSKVSLSAFERFFNGESEEEKQTFLNEHVQCIHAHVRRLNQKNYNGVKGVNAPDYVLMFMPLEQAFLFAANEDPKLYEKALRQNIAIVSPSTLMAVLRTVAFIWKQEAQKNNAMEIARQSGFLYDKFMGFMNDLVRMGEKLEGAKEDYNDAMKKLYLSPKKSTTLFGRMERLKELGADASKELPKRLRAS